MKRTAVIAVLILFMGLGISALGAIPAAQRQALIALYNATGGDSWTNNTGWKTPPLDTDGFAMPGTENTWRGVTTGASNTTVTAINLSSNNLIGSLPAAIGDLTGLTALNLHTNQLSGSLPSSLGNLTGLTLLHLYQNSFSGSLPAELGNLTNLTALDVYQNQFTGSIPGSLGNLGSLQSLLLNVNQFSGSLPAELGNLTSLLLLNCYNNQLTGSIPASFGGMTSLRGLLLHNNSLTGSIPPEIGNLANLQALYLSHNQLSGTIPPELGNLALLEEIELGHNQLTGSIPPEIGNLASLVNLHLEFNQLSGAIPPEIGGLSSVVSITIQFNQLGGPLPAELGDLSTLQQLLLHNNSITGSIPAEIGNMSGLTYLYLGHNELTGSIPATLGNLGSLLYLRLDKNHLSGAIPTELGSLTSLVDIWLCENMLTGTIPSSLGNMVSLQYLHLHGNALEGPVPASITNLTALLPEGTDIGYNSLYATDSAVTAFLDSKDADWASTQTVPPTGVTATALDGANILVSWTTIAYTAHGGYYALLSSETAGGPYADIGHTLNKGVASLQVAGLTPGRTYYFVVRTHTDAHTGNQSALDSHDSAEAWATAWTQVNVRIAGTVLVGGSPLAGVLMSGLPGNPVTNSSGAYDVTTSAGWSGTVTPALDGYAFTPPSRTYTTVTEDQLAQDYAAAEVVGATITVTAPNGGESWVAGSSHDITWTSTGLAGDVTIDLYKGGVYAKTLGTAAASAGTFAWTIASNETAGTDYRVLVWQGGTSDESDANFTLAVRKDDFVATWDAQGVYYRNSDTAAWVRLASPATMITVGDFDGDGIDDLAGLWPSQGGIWVRYSHNNAWARLSSTAVYIAAGDMNGDGRVDLLGTWDGQGVFYRNSVTGAWVRMASQATMIACGDLDGDGVDDLIGLWPSQGGIWVKYSHNNAWAQISSTARHIASGDMNGDGRDDLLGTWDGQGAFYRNSITGAWVKLASPATLITTGDIDGDGTDDLIGIWPTQGGVWARYSHNNAWVLLGSTARDISAGKMRPAYAGAGLAAAAAAAIDGAEPVSPPALGVASGPEGAVGFRDESSRGPGGSKFAPIEERNPDPFEKREPGTLRPAGPGEPGFVCSEAENSASGPDQKGPGQKNSGQDKVRKTAKH
ncbi:MAG: Ser-Thr-rich GPI-anchored membrane family protein [Acidobacteriota bacterium]